MGSDTSQKRRRGPWNTKLLARVEDQGLGMFARDWAAIGQTRWDFKWLAKIKSSWESGRC